MKFFSNIGFSKKIETTGKVPIDGQETHTPINNAAERKGIQELSQEERDADYRAYQIDAAKNRKVPDFETLGKVVLIEEDLEIQKQMDRLIKGAEFRSLFPPTHPGTDDLALQIGEDYGFKNFVDAHNTILKLDEKAKSELVDFMVQNVLALNLEARESGEFYKGEFYLGDFYREVREKSSEEQLVAWVTKKNEIYDTALEMMATGITDKVLELRKKENKYSVTR